MNERNLHSWMEKKEAQTISLKERLSKVEDFDESKVDAIFDMLIAKG